MRTSVFATFSALATVLLVACTASVHGATIPQASETIDLVLCRPNH